MHKGIFITGTDTGVGKTVVAAGLLMAFKKMGYNVCPLKPVETGCKIRDGKFIPRDAIKLIKAADVNEQVDLINPYRFRKPLAPVVAAELKGMVINKSRIISAYTKLRKKYDITIVEGAGGIMVPIHKKYLFADLIKDLNLPVIIIARPGLGTINHTLLTIEAARGRGINILGVIMNYSNIIKEDISVKTNPGVIERLGEVRVLGVVPYAIEPSLKIFRQIARKITLTTL
ncbi:MAG: dethiobiotin synthase [Nitrospirae bacterium]|nr:dethiobiotin synthase [Nitrospirota bacterium]